MFSCDRCGACCRHLERSDLYKDLDRGDGTCKHLFNNLCTIYDERPLKCRVDDSYHQIFKDQMSLDEFYRMNYEACASLKKEEG